MSNTQLNLNKEHSTLQVSADKDIVITDPHHSHPSVPAPIDVTMNKPAETLPVYTQKKWIPNKDDVDEENLKTAPTFAKLEMPKHNTTSFTVLPDIKPDLGDLASL